MPARPRGPTIGCMTGHRRLVVELELTMGERPPLEGQARIPGLPPSRFVGWSELFAVLQTMVSGYEAHGGDGAGQVPDRQHRLPGDQVP
jgi:hypothetical protein